MNASQAEAKLAAAGYKIFRLGNFWTIQGHGIDTTANSPDELVQKAQAFCGSTKRRRPRFHPPRRKR